MPGFDNVTSAFAAVIFDHDGVLVDTVRPDYEACKALFDEYNVPLSIDRWANVACGRIDGYEVLFQEVVRHHGAQIPTHRLWERLRELWDAKLQEDNISLLPGVEDLLDELRGAGLPLAVATASARNWAERWLVHFGLRGYFKVVCSGEEVAGNKPAPDVYLEAAKKLSVEPAHCLVFEDSPPGVSSAKAAGMSVVAVPTLLTRHLNYDEADGRVSDLRQISPELLLGLGC